MQSDEDGEEGWERIGLVWVGGRITFVKERDAEVEVGEGRGGEGFDEDVDHDVGVVEVGVELVPVCEVRLVGFYSIYGKGRHGAEIEGEGERERRE